MLLRKLCALSAALLGLLAANLHVVCAVGFGGAAPEGAYSPAAVRRGLAAAEATAEEILPGEGSAAAPVLRYSLRLRPPSDDARYVADAALRATEGVAVLDGVYLDHVLLGAVKNGARFAGRVQAWLFDSMPWRAYEAGFVEPFALRPLYARESSAQDPALLLDALARTAQVWYVDAEGRDVPG